MGLIDLIFGRWSGTDLFETRRKLASEELVLADLKQDQEILERMVKSRQALSKLITRWNASVGKGVTSAWLDRFDSELAKEEEFLEAAYVSDSFRERNDRATFQSFLRERDQLETMASELREIVDHTLSGD